MDHKDVMKLVTSVINRSSNGEKRAFVYTAGIQVNDDAITLLREKYIAFDVETTGLDPFSDRIVEIGAVKFNEGNVDKVFDTLVRSEVPVSALASSVNHITDEMLMDAPSEKDAVKKLVDFLGDASQGETIMCAHNADFDFRFLKEALKRSKIDAKIYYIDTLSLSRSLLHGLSNHKQETIANYFGIVNPESHRAYTDAEVCGKMLWELLRIKKEENEKEMIKKQAFERREIEKATLNDDEKRVCAYIQKYIEDNGGKTEYLSFTHVKHGCVQISYYYRFLLFKCTVNNKYIILNNDIDLCGFEHQDCPRSEAPEGYVRVFLMMYMILHLYAIVFLHHTKKRRVMQLM